MVGMFTISKWVVYDIVLTTLHPKVVLILTQGLTHSQFLLVDPSMFG